MNKKMVIVAAILLVSVVLSGCGETFHGMVKDAKRIGDGTKTIFVRE